MKGHISPREVADIAKRCVHKDEFIREVGKRVQEIAEQQGTLPPEIDPETFFPALGKRDPYKVPWKQVLAKQLAIHHAEGFEGGVEDFYELIRRELANHGVDYSDKKSVGRQLLIPLEQEARQLIQKGELAPETIEKLQSFVSAIKQVRLGAQQAVRARRFQQARDRYSQEEWITKKLSGLDPEGVDELSKKCSNLEEFVRLLIEETGEETAEPGHVENYFSALDPKKKHKVSWNKVLAKQIALQEGEKLESMGALYDTLVEKMGYSKQKSAGRFFREQVLRDLEEILAQEEQHEGEAWFEQLKRLGEILQRIRDKSEESQRELVTRRAVQMSLDAGKANEEDFIEALEQNPDLDPSKQKPSDLIQKIAELTDMAPRTSHSVAQRLYERLKGIQAEGGDPIEELGEKTVTFLKSRYEGLWEKNRMLKIAELVARLNELVHTNQLGFANKEERNRWLVNNGLREWGVTSWRSLDKLIGDFYRFVDGLAELGEDELAELKISSQEAEEIQREVEEFRQRAQERVVLGSSAGRVINERVRQKRAEQEKTRLTETFEELEQLLADTPYYEKISRLRPAIDTIEDAEPEQILRLSQDLGRIKTAYLAKIGELKKKVAQLAKTVREARDPKLKQETLKAVDSFARDAEQTEELGFPELEKLLKTGKEIRKAARRETLEPLLPIAELSSEDPGLISAIVDYAEVAQNVFGWNYGGQELKNIKQMLSFNRIGNRINRSDKQLLQEYILNLLGKLAKISPEQIEEKTPVWPRLKLAYEELEKQIKPHGLSLHPAP